MCDIKLHQEHAVPMKASMVPVIPQNEEDSMNEQKRRMTAAHWMPIFIFPTHVAAVLFPSRFFNDGMTRMATSAASAGTVNTIADTSGAEFMAIHNATKVERYKILSAIGSRVAPRALSAPNARAQNPSTQSRSAAPMKISRARVGCCGSARMMGRAKSARRIESRFGTALLIFGILFRAIRTDDISESESELSSQDDVCRMYERGDFHEFSSK